MKLLDVNVVVAAQHTDHARHNVARPWLDDLIDRGEVFTVPDLVAASVVRLTTSRRVFTVPTPPVEAFAYLGALRGAPGHRRAEPGPSHLDLLKRVCVDADAVGDLVPDAQLVALAKEHAAEIVSFDRDFARFDVRWSRPGD